MSSDRNVLILYYYASWPLRASIRDHLYAFRRHGRGYRCFYVNMAVRNFPSWMRAARFDLIIYHTTFLSTRWNLDLFSALVERADPVRTVSGTRVALPQDEFIHTDVLTAFLRAHAIDHVCSVAPPSEWPVIYGDLTTRATFHEVLTGYVEDRTVRLIHRKAMRGGDHRPIDIGYRAWRAEPWLGRHGFLKTRIADAVQVAAAARGFRLDISTRPEDTLFGDAWYDFLLRCRYTIGVEGGASLIDRTGAIRERTNRYLAAHPGASFEEVERACFPGEDGSLALHALSPRHLEACATRTCQVLVRGRYNGVLDAERHYIPLEPDFSNLEHVLASLQQEDLRTAIVDRAYREIIASGRYSYRAFARQVLAFANPAMAHASSAAAMRLRYAYVRLTDTLDWWRLRLHLVGLAAKASYILRRGVVAVTSASFRQRVKRRFAS